MHKLGDNMTIVMTPLGALEFNIPTIYGSKHQFRSYYGDVFDVPNWLASMFLFGGLGVGLYVGWQASNVLVSSAFFKKYVEGTSKGLLDQIFGVGKVREALSFLGSTKPVVKKKK